MRSGVLLRSGAHGEAWDAALHALELYLSTGDEAGAASTHGLLGRVSHAAGRPADALRHHRLAHHSYVRSGNLYGLAHTADCLAELELAAGNHGPAAEHLRVATEPHHRVGNLHYATRSCRNLRALLLFDPRRTAAATDRLDQAVTHLEDRLPLTVDELVKLIAPDTDR